MSYHGLVEIRRTAVIERCHRVVVIVVVVVVRRRQMMMMMIVCDRVFYILLDVRIAGCAVRLSNGITSPPTHPPPIDNIIELMLGMIMI